MTHAEYINLRTEIVAAGFGHEIEWSETVKAPENADKFFSEYAYVVCNSGMKAQIARIIYDKICDALTAGNTAESVFGHKAKARAIDGVFKEREKWFRDYLHSNDPVAFLESMPWIGPITKWHLAKNFGVNCCKPDRHLVRIAKNHGTTPDQLCHALAASSGDRVSTVDLVIWRAANLGMV